MGIRGTRVTFKFVKISNMFRFVAQETFITAPFMGFIVEVYFVYAVKSFTAVFTLVRL